MSLARLTLLVTFALLPALCRAEAAAQTQDPLLQFSLELDRRAAIDAGLAPLPQPALDIRDDLPPLPTIDLTTPPDDLLQRIRNGFGMPDLASPLVADRQAWYLNRPDLLRRILERSRKYLYHIVGELEKRGMPTELALLPMVESSFNPLAYSPARALGIWQFIPATGKNYNLKQNWWLDERRDILASTSAALDYLQNIYEMHGDWHLALASYNWGENAVARAIAKNQARGLPTDYASLTMPTETRYYVPKLQALKNIVAQPDLFGLRLDPIPNRAYFGTVDVDASMDVATAAKLAETPLSEFIALNPAYHRPLIPGDAKSPLVIPADKVQTFTANLARYAAEARPLSNWRTYSLKKGEKIDAVAARFGISQAHLRQINGINKRTKFVAGLNLLVPTHAAGSSPDAVVAALPQLPADLPKKLPSVRGKGGAKAQHGRAKVQPAKKVAAHAHTRAPARAPAHAPAQRHKKKR